MDEVTKQEEICEQRLYTLLDECLTWMQEVVGDDVEFISVLRGCGFEDDEMRLLGIDFEEMEEEEEEDI